MPCLLPALHFAACKANRPNSALLPCAACPPTHPLPHNNCIAAFGLTVIEAMTCGLPTFATNHGGPSEIIKHKKSGEGQQQRGCNKLRRLEMQSVRVASKRCPAARCHSATLLVARCPCQASTSIPTTAPRPPT